METKPTNGDNEGGDCQGDGREVREEREVMKRRVFELNTDTTINVKL